MLFRSEIEPRCAYCQHGEALDGQSVLCPKKGVVDGGSHCRSFSYDPFRRTPPAQLAPDFPHRSGGGALSGACGNFFQRIFLPRSGHSNVVDAMSFPAEEGELLCSTRSL